VSVNGDGEDYLYGLAREAIPPGSRILAVVDAYDAMTSQRPYREALPTASCALLLNDDNWTNALTALTILQADEKRVLFSSLSHLRLL
jgi:putative two-component system response regulator